jgi:hypothetical protein
MHVFFFSPLSHKLSIGDSPMKTKHTHTAEKLVLEQGATIAFEHARVPLGIGGMRTAYEGWYPGNDGSFVVKKYNVAHDGVGEDQRGHFDVKMQTFIRVEAEKFFQEYVDKVKAPKSKDSKGAKTLVLAKNASMMACSLLLVQGDPTGVPLFFVKEDLIPESLGFVKWLDNCAPRHGGGGRESNPSRLLTPANSYTQKHFLILDLCPITHTLEPH